MSIHIRYVSRAWFNPMRWIKGKLATVDVHPKGVVCECNWETEYWITPAVGLGTPCAAAPAPVRFEPLDFAGHPKEWKADQIRAAVAELKKRAVPMRILGRDFTGWLVRYGGPAKYHFSEL
jgi:hypothetical protein